MHAARLPQQAVVTLLDMLEGITTHARMLDSDVHARQALAAAQVHDQVIIILDSSCYVTNVDSVPAFQSISIVRHVITCILVCHHELHSKHLLACCAAGRI